MGLSASLTYTQRHDLSLNYKRFQTEEINSGLFHHPTLQESTIRGAIDAVNLPAIQISDSDGQKNQQHTSLQDTSVGTSPETHVPIFEPAAD